MTVLAAERVCARDGCGQPVTGRADKRYCSDVCRTAHGRSRTKPNRTPITASGLATVSVIRAEPAQAWEPPGEPRRAGTIAEKCTGCGEPLIAGRRGTWRACGSCRTAVVPAAVSRLYERGEDAPQRQVTSQHERDLAALELVRRKGVMLAQLAQLADDDRLAEESRPVVEWFGDQVRAASSQARLGELAALLPQAGIRRRRWWQGSPEAIEAPAWDADDIEDQDHDEDQDQDRGGYPLAIEAAAAAAIDWAAELAARGYRIDPAATDEGRCCIEATRGLSPGPCPGGATGTFGPYRVCQRHHGALTYQGTR